MASREVQAYMRGLEERKDVVAAFVFHNHDAEKPAHVTTNGEKIAAEYTKHLGHFIGQANAMLREMEEDNHIKFLGFR